MATSKNTPRARLNIEKLEARDNPSTLVRVYDGRLDIYGDAANDQILVRQTGQTIGVYDYNQGRWVASLGLNKLYSGKVSFTGNNGNDWFRNDSGLQAEAKGGEGDDTLWGGWNADKLYGGNGADSLMGQGGNDQLQDGGTDSRANKFWGGTGNDILRGGRGNDTLVGEQDNDVIYGSFGNDYLVGGAGYDELYGDNDNDVLDGGVSDGCRDRLEGGLGADWYRNDGATNVEVFIGYSSREGDRAFNNYA